MQFIKFVDKILKHSERTQSHRACVFLRNNFIQWINWGRGNV